MEKMSVYMYVYVLLYVSTHRNIQPARPSQSANNNISRGRDRDSGSNNNKNKDNVDVAPHTISTSQPRNADSASVWNERMPYKNTHTHAHKHTSIQSTARANERVQSHS